jgi:hypothetical protein
MTESERVQRIKADRELESYEANERDDRFGKRIAALLNHPKIDKYCMVDAYYYDFSVIPRGIQEKMNLWRDHYLIYGITTGGEIVSKWVDRWDLDCDDPVVNGKVIQEEKCLNRVGNWNVSPEIRVSFDAKLLSTPCIDLSEIIEGI